MSEWQPIETAPKGGGAEMVTDPAYVDPPSILVRDGLGVHAVVHWDAYYAEGGSGFHVSGGNGWVLEIAGEPLGMHHITPTEWMPLP